MPRPARPRPTNLSHPHYQPPFPASVSLIHLRGSGNRKQPAISFLQIHQLSLKQVPQLSWPLIMAGQLLAVAAERNLAQLDEKLYFEVFAPPDPRKRRVGATRP